jgi:SWI/SNF-related matrix-associated actin-dependent regulator 1 of chromatin subfamily A
MVRRLKKDVLKELPPKRRQLITLEDSQIDWTKHPQFRRWHEVYETDYNARLAALEAAQTDLEYKTAALALEKFTGIAFEEMSEFRHATALAKLPLCLKYLDDMLDSGVENVVVFAHHTDVLEKMKEHFGDDAVIIYGKTPESGPNSRENAVKQFQEKKKKIFLGQIRAAGIGITLTAANTVVFVEIDWVPGVLSQAEDRLCRIGQKKMVHVIHLVLGNTLDANMVKKIVEKQKVIDRALDLSTDVVPKTVAGGKR